MKRETSYYLYYSFGGMEQEKVCNKNGQGQNMIL